MIPGYSARATAGIITRITPLVSKFLHKLHMCAHLTLTREWAIVATGLRLRGDDVIRMLSQDFRSIGVDGRGDDNVAACQQHVHATVHSAQTQGAVFVMQEGKQSFAGLKSDSVAVAAAAAAGGGGGEGRGGGGGGGGGGALVFEGSWSHVFDSVMSYFNSQP
jgi:hypothetical protein